MTPEQYCQSKAVKSGSSFYYSFLFLPKRRRRAIIALYAFCREIDDTVDETTDPHIARIKLEWWRQEIKNVFAYLADPTGNPPQHPVCRELFVVVPWFALSQSYFLEMIDGMAMDLNQNRYSDFPALQLYCYRVASLVGLLAAKIFGYQSPQTAEYAYKLGIALQLTNIVRDVGEDARRGRIYLPLDELGSFQVTPSEILQGEASSKMVALLNFQIERARAWFAEAYKNLPAEDLASQRPGLIMAKIYQALLDELQRDPAAILRQRIALTPLRKLWIAWRTWTFPRITDPQ